MAEFLGENLTKQVIFLLRSLTLRIRKQKDDFGFCITNFLLAPLLRSKGRKKPLRGGLLSMLKLFASREPFAGAPAKWRGSRQLKRPPASWRAPREPMGHVFRCRKSLSWEVFAGKPATWIVLGLLSTHESILGHEVFYSALFKASFIWKLTILKQSGKKSYFNEEGEYSVMDAMNSHFASLFRSRKRNEPHFKIF